jgi:hypothetical protein
LQQSFCFGAGSVIIVPIVRDDVVEDHEKELRREFGQANCLDVVVRHID